MRPLLTNNSPSLKLFYF